MIKKASAVTL